MPAVIDPDSDMAMESHRSHMHRYKLVSEERHGGYGGTISMIWFSKNFSFAYHNIMCGADLWFNP